MQNLTLAQQRQAATAVTVTHTTHKRAYNPAFSVQQRKQLNARNIALYTLAQQQAAAAVARELQALYFKQRVYVNYNVHSISIKVSNASVIQAVRYIAAKHNASITNTDADNVLLHIAQH